MAGWSTGVINTARAMPVSATDAEFNRSAHFTVGIWIRDERDRGRAKLLSDCFSAMSKHDDDLSDACRAKVANAGFNYSLVTKGKKRFEFAHAARAAGGENDCGDVIHRGS